MSLEGVGESSENPRDERRRSTSPRCAQSTVEGAPVSEAELYVPPRPGLYAIHGAAGVWRDLGLGDPPGDRPLYVGKAEDNLVSRDLKTHFGNG